MVREITTRCMMDKSKLKDIKDWIINPSGSKVYNEMVDKLWKLYKESGFLSARIYEYINKDNLYLIDNTKVLLEDMETFPTNTFNVLSVHDCYRCHPNYGNDIRKQYIINLAKIHESRMFEFILNQILPNKIKLNNTTKFTQDILNSEYALS